MCILARGALNVTSKSLFVENAQISGESAKGISSPKTWWRSNFVFPQLLIMSLLNWQMRFCTVSLVHYILIKIS